DYPRDNKTVNGRTLYATWQDYRNQEFDIQLSVSTDGGLTWNEAGAVNPDRGTDHYFPAVEVTPAPGGDRDVQPDRNSDNRNNNRVGVSSHRPARVRGETPPPTTGFGCPPGAAPPAGVNTEPQFCTAGPKNSDYVLAGLSGPHTPAQFKVIS